MKMVYYCIIDLYTTKHKIMWKDDEIAFSGIPYVVVSHKWFDCQHGIDRNKNAKMKQKEKTDADFVCKIT